MTTKVKIEIVQEHMPIVVDFTDQDGIVMYTDILKNIGSNLSEYIHFGKRIQIREMTAKEFEALNES